MLPIKISIITVSFNSEKTIRETIESVLGQNYPNLEYIIIDGKSTDRTLEIIREYGDRITKVVSEPDNGVADAFNKGIQYASGEIIGLINSDDLLADNACQILADAYDQTTDVYRGNIVVWNDLSGGRFVCIPTMEFPINKIVKSVCHQGTFIRKAAYEKYGLYKEDFHYMMDKDLLYRFYAQGAKFKRVDANLAIFRVGGITSDSFIKKIPELKKMYSDNGASSLLILKNVIMFVLYQIGKSILKMILGNDIHKYNKGKYK